jgi:hypothetical protein
MACGRTVAALPRTTAQAAIAAVERFTEPLLIWTNVWERSQTWRDGTPGNVFKYRVSARCDPA